MHIVSNEADFSVLSNELWLAGVPVPPHVGVVGIGQNALQRGVSRYKRDDVGACSGGVHVPDVPLTNSQTLLEDEAGTIVFPADRLGIIRLG